MIYSVKTYLGQLFELVYLYTFILLFVIFIFPLFGVDYSDWDLTLLWGGTAIFVITAAMIYEKRRFLDRRRSKVQAMALARKLHYSYSSGVELRSKNFMMIKQRDVQVNNVITGNDWHYGEVTYYIYRKYRSSEYKAESVHYSIVELDLPRVLPNMLFDGMKAHGQQFRWLIDADQVASLEGDFDDYFVTYFPEQYHIDARSIISPEVMAALIDMSPCDGEIYGDKLYIYSGLLPADDIEEYIKKAQHLRRVLMDHAKYYIDELSSTEGKDVSVFGYQLNKRNTFPWVFIVILTSWTTAFGFLAYGREMIRFSIAVGVYIAVIGYVVYVWNKERVRQQKRRSRLEQAIIRRDQKRAALQSKPL